MSFVLNSVITVVLLITVKEKQGQSSQDFVSPESASCWTFVSRVKKSGTLKGGVVVFPCC